MNIAIPLKSLQLTFYTFAWDFQSEDREKDQEGEDEQNRDSKYSYLNKMDGVRWLLAA